MDAKELLTKAEADLNLLREERERLTTRLEEIRMQGNALRDQVDSLRELVERYEPGSQFGLVDTGSDIAPNAWMTMSRFHAVAEALSEADRPVSPREIATILHSHGRDDQEHLVSPILNYVRKKGLGTNIGHGKWVATRPEGVAAAAS